MEQKSIDPSFNFQESRDTKTGVTDRIEIETSLPVVLFQEDEPKKEFPHYVRQYIPETASVGVWGDEVAVFGRICTPGRDVEIFARTFRSLPAPREVPPKADVTDPGSMPATQVLTVVPPEIDVSGAEPPAAKEALTVSSLWKATTNWVPRGRATNGKGETGYVGVTGVKALSGGPGQSPKDEHDERMHGQAGDAGAPGHGAGNILICCERMVRDGDLDLALIANGGKGQDGQAGQAGAYGGDGGPGGDLSVGINNHAPTNGGPGGKGGDGGKGGRGGQGGKGGEIQVLTCTPVPGFEARCSGGPGGDPGQGGARGEAGNGGPAGRGHMRVAGKPVFATGGSKGTAGEPGSVGDPAPPSADGSFGHKEVDLRVMAGRCRVTQLQMVFEGLRARYLATDPVRDAAAMKEIGDSLAWLDTLLVSYPQDRADKAHAVALGYTVLSARQTQDIGLDYFGKTPAFMPAVSIGTYQAAIDQALTYLQEAETNYLAYFDALKTAQRAADELRQAHRSISAAKGYMKDKKRETVATLVSFRKKVDEAEVARKADAKRLMVLLQGFEDRVTSAFGISPQTLFNCLSQLAFIGESPFNAGAMVVSQAGTALLEASEKVLTDSGESLNKSYVLGEIAKIKGATGKELKAEFVQMAGGLINESASYKYLVQLQALQELCDAFRQSLSGAFDAALAIDRHIKLIAQRNLVIGYYNDACRRLVDLGGEVSRCELQTRQFDAEHAAEQARLPAMTSLVAGYYERAKAECIREIYLAKRAYAFWSLECHSGFYGGLGETAALRSADLKAIAEGIKIALLARLNEVRAAPNWFPKLASGNDALGVLVVMTDQSHPDVFADLRTNFSAEFELLPAVRGCRAPIQEADPTVHAARYYSLISPKPAANAGQETFNPFHGKANVRITRIRPWLIGMKTAPNRAHEIAITHLGYERFRTPQDAPFPEEEGPDGYVEHLPLRKIIRYNPVGLSYSAVNGAFTPGSFAGLPDMEDGDLDSLDLRSAAALGQGQGVEPLSALPRQGSYAPIGPFGRWRIEAHPRDNGFVKDQDASMLANLSAIVIDFHGFYQPFER